MCDYCLAHNGGQGARKESKRDSSYSHQKTGPSSSSDTENDAWFLLLSGKVSEGTGLFASLIAKITGELDGEDK